jgi:hypothetical protein
VSIHALFIKYLLKTSLKDETLLPELLDSFFAGLGKLLLSATSPPLI